MFQTLRGWTVSRGRRSGRGARGAVAVEFALIVSFVLAPLLVGMIQTGWSLYNALSISGAVRDGARFAATGDASQASWVTDVNNQVRSLTYASNMAQANQTSVCVELYKQGTGRVKWNCSQGTGPMSSLPGDDALPANILAAASDPTGHPALTLDPGQCVVRVVAARTYSISFVLGSVSHTLYRGSVARYERGAC